jgi:hypothetical protein
LRGLKLSKARKFISAQNVNMEMKDGLTRRRSAVYNQPKTVGYAQIGLNFAQLQKTFREVVRFFFVERGYVRVMLLRNHKEMNFGFRIYIAYDNHSLVLIKPFGRNFAPYDFTKNTIVRHFYLLIFLRF